MPLTHRRHDVRPAGCRGVPAVVPAVVTAAVTVVLTVVATVVVTVVGWLLTTSAAGAAGAPAADEKPPGVWPLSPRPAVVHGFDPPDVPWGRGHRGVDLAGRVGQPVRTALPGTVTFAGRVAGRGVVVVGHGPTRTTYEPVVALVRRGQQVARGQVIGTLAWFGTHCLPAACLHWGLRADDTYLDPLQLVGGPLPVRLLPVSGAGPVEVEDPGPLWSDPPPLAAPRVAPPSAAPLPAPLPVLALVAVAGAAVASTAASVTPQPPDLAVARE